MGREIRRVPKGWEHPENDDERCRERTRDTRYYKPTEYQYGRCFIPMYDNDYETAAQEWLANFDLWRSGKHEDQQGEYASSAKYFWEYHGPPDEKYYRPKFDSEPTCYQVYETVSEGTPTSPVFETLDELAAYLVTQGYSEKAAHNFAHDGYAPSMVMFNPGNGGPVTMFNDIESAAIDRKTD